MRQNKDHSYLGQIQRGHPRILDLPPFLATKWAHSLQCCWWCELRGKPSCWHGDGTKSLPWNNTLSTLSSLSFNRSSSVVAWTDMLLDLAADGHINNINNKQQVYQEFVYQGTGYQNKGLKRSLFVWVNAFSDQVNKFVLQISGVSRTSQRRACLVSCSWVGW